MSISRFRGLGYNAAAAVALATFAIQPSVRASIVNLQGMMDTTAVLSDSVLLKIPVGVPELVIRFPVLKDETDSNTPSVSNSQRVGQEDIVCSLDPTQEKTIKDVSGNCYRELVFKNPPAGEVTIRAKTGLVDLSANLETPLADVSLPIKVSLIPDDVTKYLGTSKYAQSDSPEIVALSAQIVSGSTSEADAASRISTWIKTNIRYGGGTRLSDTDALSALHNRSSICSGWAHLFIALARASGIPARFVGGYVIAGSFTYPTSTDGIDKLTTTNASLMHAWVELYYPGQGWVDYDPQTSAGFVDTHHVRLWASVDGGSTLPLVTWESVGNVQDVTFTECESATNVSDRMDIRCCGEEGDRLTGPILLTR